jgi:hypothetical protein
MLRIVLACLLALTMAAGPLRASAATSPCDQAPMHATMAMSGEMAMAHGTLPDSTTGHPAKATCADICAAASTAAVVLPASSAAVPLASDLATPRPLTPQGLASREPDRFDPPPKPRT